MKSIERFTNLLIYNSNIHKPIKHRGIHKVERTFLMIKPDAVQRNLIGEVISRIERKGLKLVGGKLMQVPMELAETHYGEQGKTIL